MFVICVVLSERMKPQMLGRKTALKTAECCDFEPVFELGNAMKRYNLMGNTAMSVKFKITATDS